MAHTFNPSTQEAGASRSQWIWGQRSLQSKFQDNQGYTETSCLKKQNKQTKILGFLILRQSVVCTVRSGRCRLHMCNMYFARKSCRAEVTKCCLDFCKSVPFCEITSYYNHLKIESYILNVCTYLPRSLFQGKMGTVGTLANFCPFVPTSHVLGQWHMLACWLFYAVLVGPKSRTWCLPGNHSSKWAPFSSLPP